MLVLKKRKVENEPFFFYLISLLRTVHVAIAAIIFGRNLGHSHFSEILFPVKIQENFTKRISSPISGMLGESVVSTVHSMDI